MKTAYERSAQVIETGNGYSVHVERIVRPGAGRAHSIVFVNGALATSRSFRWTIAGLPGADLIFFDLPHVGLSRRHNLGRPAVGPDAEVAILQTIIQKYSPDCLASMSWGGFTALLALSKGPSSVKKAVIASFSDHVSRPLRNLLRDFDAILETREYSAGAQLLNATLGKFLPIAAKRANYAYLMGLGESERDYIKSRIEYVLRLNPAEFAGRIKDIRCNLLFLNGERDEFAPLSDLSDLVGMAGADHAVKLPGAGHFLAAECRTSLHMTATIVNTYLGGETPRRAPPGARRSESYGGIAK